MNQVIEIPTLGGGFSEALGLNELAQVVGIAETVSGETHAILFSDGVLIDLGTLGGPNSTGHAINDNGWVAGEAQLPGGDVHAFIWTAGGGMTDIGTLGGPQSAALDINNNGFVTGWSHAADNNPIEGGGSPHAFRYDGETMTDLARTPNGDGGLFSRGNGISDSAVVVGEATQIITKLAAKWEGDNPIFLSNVKNTRALATNDGGTSVGYYPFGGYSILWHPNGTFLILFIDEANDINNARQVAGSLDGHAVVWDGGLITDLNDLLPAGSGWVLESATAINDVGQVVGVGTLDGEPRGFLFRVVDVELLDPVLSLMSGLDVTTDLQVLATTPGRPVIGAAADGVTRIVVRISGLPGPGEVELRLFDEVGGTNGVGTLRTPGGIEDVTTLDVPVTVLSDGRAMAIAVYVAPADFIRDGADSTQAIRHVRLDATYQAPGAGGPVLVSQQILLRRPPVLLLHGLWSNSATWKMPIANDDRFLVFAHDYEVTHAQNFTDNLIQPRRGVQRALMMARRRDFAATQADVVGHSMGGLLTRMYISDVYGDSRATYRRRDNFGAGDVNRLISLDTPHKGSPLANVLIGIP
ncbi:MAG: alpha/beta fold hydrolase [Phycisphaerales bacterium]